MIASACPDAAQLECQSMILSRTRLDRIELGHTGDGQEIRHPASPCPCRRKPLLAVGPPPGARFEMPP